MISQVIEKKAERVAQLTGKDSGEAVLGAFLDEELERLAIEGIVEEARMSGFRKVNLETYAEDRKKEMRLRHGL